MVAQAESAAFEIARFIGHALDELRIDRAHPVLHDFGGPWGLRWAAEHPSASPRPS